MGAGMTIIAALPAEAQMRLAAFRDIAIAGGRAEAHECKKRTKKDSEEHCCLLLLKRCAQAR